VSNLRGSVQLSILDPIKKNLIFGYNVYREHAIDRDIIGIQIKEIIRPIFRNYIPHEQEFNNAFDLFEMILAVLSVSKGQGLIPHDAIMSDYYYFHTGYHIVEFWKSGGKLGHSWEFLRVLFGGDIDKLDDALKHYRDAAIQSQYSHHNERIPNYADEYRTALSSTI
jgi:hypothetical protein